jgi:serine/threonine protein kinase
MNNIKYTNQSEKVMYYKDLIFSKNQVCKVYNTKCHEIDCFEMTPTMYYQVERMMYEKLHNIFYKTKSGRKMKLIPNCLEIGNNYFIIEKYDKTLSEEIRKICKTYQDLQNFIEEYIKPIAKKLDQLDIIHGDLHPRNIVIEHDMKNVSIIDFGLSFLVNKNNKTYKNVKMVNDFIDDFETMCYYPELSKKFF